MNKAFLGAIPAALLTLLVACSGSAPEPSVEATREKTESVGQAETTTCDPTACSDACVNSGYDCGRCTLTAPSQCLCPLVCGRPGGGISHDYSGADCQVIAIPWGGFRCL